MDLIGKVVEMFERAVRCHNGTNNCCGRRVSDADVVVVSSARALDVNFRGLLVCSPRRTATVYISNVTTANTILKDDACA